MKKKSHRILLAGVIAVAAFALYFAVYYKADDTVDEYVAASPIQVTETSSYIACGDADQAQTGYIFYPGAKVDSRAYLPYLLDVAEKSGAFCVVVKPTFHLAILSPDLADEVIGAYPAIEQWFLGGHSLGGVVASSYALEHQSEIDGLIFLASYPSADLSAASFPVLSVTASEDHVINVAKYAETEALLPPGTQYHDIEGGNHCQFGRYGFQYNDGVATISPQEQQDAATELTVGFLLAENQNRQ